MFPMTEQIHTIIGYGWLIAALLLLLLEVGTPGLFFFISLSVGALSGALFAFLDFSFFVQAAAWSISSLLSLIFLRFTIKKKSSKILRTNVNALIDQEAVVISIIEPHKVGYVKVKGEQWPAIAQQGIILHPGTVVTVIALQGNKLIVR